MNDFKPGLEGIVAVETEIAEPDREGGQLRYRGVDIEELVGNVPYEYVWGLLVDNDLGSKMPDPEPYEPAGLTGNAPADLQAENRNYLGGDINGGVMDLGQLAFRPTAIPYRTPLRGIYLCSSATPPGGGVHGLCGVAAARLALRDLR